MERLKILKLSTMCHVNKNMTGESGMYVNKVQIAGDYVLVSNYTHRLFGAPHHKRNRRSGDTPKAMAEYNRRKRAEKLQLLMIMNFDCGYHITLDYPKDARPETYEEAEKNLKKFLYKMSRKVREIKPFKYIAITERGKRREALHHHMVIEGDPFLLREITRLWGNHIKISQMYEEGAYKDLAEYFCKIETKEEQTKGRSKYHRSRNLKEPEVKTRIVAGGVPSDPVVPDEYDLVNDSEVSGFNEFVGIRFQKYMIRKKPRPEKGVQFDGNFKALTKSDPNRRKRCTIWESLKKIFKRRN